MSKNRTSAGNVFCNNFLSNQSNYDVKLTQNKYIDLYHYEPYNMQQIISERYLSVMFEDNNRYIITNKPSNMVVHPLWSSGTLIYALLYRLVI